ncbi:MAG TPA: hypothetical protein VMY69_03715 [Phycisphaerae bacterium]|nr:hypothetical protein [Phycisphaerae bacterium]
MRPDRTTWVLILAVAAFFAVFLFYPIAGVFESALWESTGPTLHYVRNVLAKASIREGLANALGLAVATTILASVLADYLRVALVENHAALRKAWQRLIGRGLPAAEVAELGRPLVSEDEMLRLGREVWMPILAADAATADEKARLTRREEARRRQKSDLETAWSRELRARYERLAK